MAPLLPRSICFEAETWIMGGGGGEHLYLYLYLYLPIYMYAFKKPRRLTKMLQSWRGAAQRKLEAEQQRVNFRRVSADWSNLVQGCVV